MTDLPSPIQKQAGDTLLFSGEGFVQGDSIIASITGIENVVSKSTINFSHGISGWLVIPELTDGNYYVSLYGKQSGAVTSSENIHVTHALKYECENLWTSSSSLAGTSRYLNLEFMFGGPWSQNAVLDFDPVPNCKKVSVNFTVPYSDTFDVGIEYGRGSIFGNYEIWVDDTLAGLITGYNASGQVQDSLSLGRLALAVGTHSISFQYTGRYNASVDSQLWADYITLDPVSNFHNADTPLAATAPTGGVFLYPNPVSDELIVLDSSADESNVSTTITDALGRIVLSPKDPTRIFVADLPSGIYYLRIRKSEGEINRSFSVIH